MALTVFDERVAVQESLVLGLLERLASETSVSITTKKGRVITTYRSSDDDLVHGDLITKVRSEYGYLEWSDKGPKRGGAHSESKDIAKSFIMNRSFRSFGTEVFCKLGCVSISGARNAAGVHEPGVPQLREDMNASGRPTSYCCAKPKSIKIGLSSVLRRMLEGLMSLCEIPCL